MQLMKISELKVHPQNSYYFDDIVGESWTDFLKSVETSGVIEPIVITSDKTIVSGHQRVRACKELNIEEVLTEMRRYESEDQVLKDLIETNIRQRGIGNPNPVKFGRCIRELERIYSFKRGNPHQIAQIELINSDPKNEKEFADVLGISLASLKRYKQLADLIPEVEDFLDTGMITANTALAISRQLCMDDQKLLLSQLDQETKYTAKEMQKYVDEIKELKEEQKVSTAKLTDKLNKATSACENLQTKYDDTLSQNESYKEEISQLKNGQLSQPAKDADLVYDFWQKTNEFVKTNIAPLQYDEFINNCNSDKCRDYVMRSCNMLIEAASDLMKRFKVSEVVYDI